MSQDGNDKHRVIKANYMLQAKVGSGPLDERVVEQMQAVMDKDTTDFGPIAQPCLETMDRVIKQAKTDNYDMKTAVAELTTPVMQLKANAKTFKYDLIGNLATIMLNFLEHLRDLDNEVIEIIAAHHTTLNAIIVKKMSGDGGPVGKQFENELKAACDRYMAKRT